MNNIERKLQTIYINIDDSGKLSKKEIVSIYGGIVFLSKEEKDKFITQYRSIINDIKCHYCNQKEENNCNKTCPELKSFNLKPQHKRRIVNYIKKYYTIGCIIENSKIYEHIMEDVASKGRYLDYALKRLIKTVIEDCIKNKQINPYLPVKLIINIDEQSTKSNGYYDLKEGIKEELIHGIHNFNCNIKYEPILFNELKIKITYQHSDKSYAIQASDLIAGTIRHKFIDNSSDHSKLINELSIINTKIFLP